jgi:aminoglycoside phosphotransferase (APT) family kinase protein
VTSALPSRALDWVAEAVGGRDRIGAVTHLPGTSFHANHAIELLGGDPLVLRRWADAGWQLTDAEFDVRREASVLALLADSPVPAPGLVAADPDGERCDVPALLLTFLPGRPPDEEIDETTLIDGLAALAEAIHSVDARDRVPAYRPYVPAERLAVPAWSGRPRLWERAIALARTPPPPGRDCLIHGDFHPGNTLWDGGRPSGVVDWSYASWGPAAVDAASLRWNIAVDWGPRAADRVPNSHPYWDVVTVLDLVCEDPGEPPAERMGERLELYLERVLG